MSNPTPSSRDLRLDFFRGLALLLIFVAHLPGNRLAHYRPGVFGFSDSADIFVFVSGFSAALAYGKIFSRAGFLAGSARVLKRCGELYACHLGLFFSVAVILVWGNRLLDTEVDYVNLLNLEFFFDRPQDAISGLFTLTYVPNYFDILPMYVVCIAMVPAVLLLARVRAVFAAVLIAALYLAVQIFGLHLPAEISFHRPWFFNPFAWQFLFYTGFFMGAGWIKPPPVRAWLTACCAAYLVLCIPMSHLPTYSSIPWMNALRHMLNPLVSKTNLGILRWIHLLALAYLMVVLFKGRERTLERRTAAPLVKTGQQALPAFLVGMVLSHLAGMMLDVFGRSLFWTLIVNAAGMVMIVLTAYTSEWFKSQPWRKKAGPAALPNAGTLEGMPYRAP
ncbi:MAG: OpgC domain-containing protein [Desulfobacteraceae bacterium]|nr:MAG: OpgC domain-containing protein [Desulfobacteraceae bacterium]